MQTNYSIYYTNINIFIKIITTEIVVINVKKIIVASAQNAIIIINVIINVIVVFVINVTVIIITIILSRFTAQFRSLI